MGSLYKQIGLTSTLSEWNSSICKRLCVGQKSTTQKRALIWPYCHPDHASLASRSVRYKFLLFTSSSLPGILLQQPTWTKIHYSKDGHNKGQKWYGPNRRRWYQEEGTRIHRRNIQKDLPDPDYHSGVLTHLEPAILECEIKWALRSIMRNKGSGGDGIPVELFQIQKDDAVKAVHSICQ